MEFHGGKGELDDMRLFFKNKIVLVLSAAIIVCIIPFVIGPLFGKTEHYSEQDKPESSSSIAEERILRANTAAIEEIAEIHRVLNVKVCFGMWEHFVNKEDRHWDDPTLQSVLLPEKYDGLARQLTSLEGAPIDMGRLKKLADIAKQTRDVTALKYMHRIIHDLDYWVLSTWRKGDFWGVTESFNEGDSYKKGVGTITDYIEEKKKR